MSEKDALRRKELGLPEHTHYLQPAFVHVFQVAPDGECFGWSESRTFVRLHLKEPYLTLVQDVLAAGDESYPLNIVDHVDSILEEFLPGTRQHEAAKRIFPSSFPGTDYDDEIGAYEQLKELSDETPRRSTYPTEHISSVELVRGKSRGPSGEEEA